MRHSLLALSLIAVLAGCQPSTTPASTDSPAATTTVAAQGEADQAFAALADRALATWFEQSPISATRTGEHRHDARIDDLSAEGRQRAVEANRALLERLAGALEQAGSLDAAEIAAILGAKAAEPPAIPPPSSPNDQPSNAADATERMMGGADGAMTALQDSRTTPNLNPASTGEPEL